ncbi:Myosin light polypeptide 6 [Mactra antiquata]
MLTDEQKKFATWAFESLDGRRTGTIPSNKETLLEAIRLSGLNPSENDVEQLMRGQEFGLTLSKDEFLMIMSQMEWKSTEEVKNTLLDDFGIFTNQHPGVITTEELVYVLTREGRERISVGEAKHIVEKFDIDQEGNICIDKLIDTVLAVTPVTS